MAWNNLLRNVDIGIAAHQLGNNGDFIPFTHHDVGHNYIRLLNILSYASFTLSHRPILTPRGMRRLVERHIITPREREILVSASKLPATQKHNMVLLWITRAVIEAREAGHIRGGSGFEEQFLEQIDSIRANYGAIGGELQARMPFGTWLT